MGMLPTDNQSQAPTRPRPAGLSAVLLETGVVSASDLRTAEQHAARERIELTDALVALGLASERDAYDAAATAAGTERIDLEELASSELAVRLVPEKLARRLFVVPIHVSDRTLTYATCRPFARDTDQDLAFASGRRTHMVVATRTAVTAALDQDYPRLRDLDVLAERMRPERPDVEPMDALLAPAAETTDIEMCNNIVGRAVEMGASDVQIECGAAGTSVHFRICGVLEPVLTLPDSVAHPIRQRFKIMARVAVAVRSRPQNGAFRVKVNTRPVDVRLSTVPTLDGEKLVLRVTDSQSPPRTLDQLGFDPDSRQRFELALRRRDGLVLVTGPAGSGRTTTLYAALAHLRSGHVSVVSVEDPVERTLSGVTQVSVNPRAGQSFASTLRSLLPQEPNAIMIGEIGDGEVAEVAGQAARTGHLVLSSLAAADAAAAVGRLQSLGLGAVRLAETLSAVVAQRLVRTLCPECRRVHGEFEARQLGAQHRLARVPASAGVGCPHCRQTGYTGRALLVEVLTPTGQVRDAITRGATADDIRAAMKAAGCATLRDRALALVADGLTSIEEINRVLAVDQATSVKPERRPRVLITDDEPLTRMLVKLLLERAQFEVLEGTNGRQAIEIAVRERPDLVLMDLNMPEMNGYEAIAQLRKDFTLTTLPIIVLTAEEGDGVERRVLALGADDYLVKPFDPEVLLSRVLAVFRRLKVSAA